MSLGLKKEVGYQKEDSQVLKVYTVRAQSYQ